eukprot:2415649-Pyramimonas_sp.AAC.1
MPVQRPTTPADRRLSQRPPTLSAFRRLALHSAARLSLDRTCDVSSHGPIQPLNKLLDRAWRQDWVSHLLQE